MIKKMTDEILDNPKDRDVKQKSQDEAVNTRKIVKDFVFLTIFQTLLFILSDSKFGQSHGTHNSR